MFDSANVSPPLKAPLQTREALSQSAPIRRPVMFYSCVVIAFGLLALAILSLVL